MRNPWRVLAIVGWAIVLIGVGFAAAMVGPGLLKPTTGAHIASSPAATPSPIPTPSPTANPTSSPTPAAAPTPTKAHFIVVAVDWGTCSSSVCLGHGIFQNSGGSAGSASVTFSVPDFSVSCTTVIPLTLPQGSAQASCDLGAQGKLYHDEHPPGSVPLAQVTNA